MTLAIDPATGKPVEPAATPPVVQVPAEEWGAMKARLDTFEKMGFNQNRQEPATPAAAPTGPSHSDQIASLEAEITKLDEAIDAAVDKGKPISKMMKERSALDRKITRLQIKHEDIDPALSAGIQTIDQISAEISRGKMPYYDIVRDDVESTLKAMPANERMNPRVREAAYQMAVGKNITKITEAQKEEMLRKAAADQTGAPPGGNNGRTTPADPSVPDPEKFLKPETLAAITSVGKTPDEYFKGVGYKGGYTEWYKKHYGKKEGDK
jgi:hypothetical protein